MCADFLVKQRILTFLAQIFPEMNFCLKIQKTNVRIRISILEIPCVPFSGKTNNFDFLGPNLRKNEFWGRNFKNLSLGSEPALPRYHVCQFSVKMHNFEFFGLNLEKLPNYMQYFGLNIVKGVAEEYY